MNKIRIAAVTPSSISDANQLENWRRFYADYADSLYKHIIVDNGSGCEYVNKVKERFQKSIVIELNRNLGTTGAFNEGIRYALSDPIVDAVFLIVQDIRCSIDTLDRLSETLNSNSKIGVVGGVVFAGGTAQKVESYGGSVDWRDFSLKFNCQCVDDIDSLPETLEADCITGGFNLAKREVYERVGLQDERLFMYCDEIDWDYRVAQAGYKLVVTKSARVWHEHDLRNRVYIPNRKLATFYDARNHCYLIRKYNGSAKMFTYCLGIMKTYPRAIGGALLHGKSHTIPNAILPQMFGLLYGMLGLMGRRNLYTPK